MKTNRKAGPAVRRERREFSAEFKAEAVRLVAKPGDPRSEAPPGCLELAPRSGSYSAPYSSTPFC